MTEPVRIRAGELGAEDIVAALEDGDRVVVETEVLGAEHEVTLRHDGDRFYCDTPTTLHTHERREEMLECPEAGRRQRLRPAPPSPLAVADRRGEQA